jgi:hypothetical protein
MAIYAIRYTDDDISDDMPTIAATSVNQAKSKLKDHADLDLFFWSRGSERLYCVACLRGGVWSDGYGYGAA